MSKIISVLVALACVASFACFVPGAAHAAGEKTELLARTIESAKPKGKAAVFAALPPELKENFVLIKKSRSRQRGTPALPRVLHFSKNVDLVVSLSGHEAPNDLSANDLEIMELDETTGEWIFSTISFNETGVTGLHKNVQFCLHCHGTYEARPIWGDYPNWPTAYGGSLAIPEKMDGQELADFIAFSATAPLHEAYRHLEWTFANDQFSLKNTVYGYPNSVFTARLGVRTAQALFVKARRAADWKRNGSAFAAYALSCAIPEKVAKRVESAYEARMKSDATFNTRWSPKTKPTDTGSLAIRLLDLDPTVDFDLDDMPTQAGRRESLDLQKPWNAGVDYLPSLLAFKFFVTAYESDPALRTAFASSASAIESIEKDSYLATNERLAQLDDPSTTQGYVDGLFPSLHFKVWKDPTLRRVACDALNAKAL